MKKLIFSMLLILAFCGFSRSSIDYSDIRFDTVQPTESLVKLLRDKIESINNEFDKVGGAGNIGTGNIYYVDSAVGSDSYDGLLPEHAFATIDAAIDACTTDNGDIIYVMQGHSETKSATGALLTADIAGVTIRGLGIGDNRPKLTLSHTGAKIDITADNVRFSNFYIDATGVDSVNTPLNVSGVGCIIDNIFGYMADDDGQADIFITVGIADGDANDLIISDCRFVSPIAGAASAITFAKDMKNVVLNNLNIYGDFSTSAIEIPAGGNACKNVVIANSFIYSLNADEPAIEVNGTSCTGAIINCILISDAEATIVDAGGLIIDNATSLRIIGTSEGAPLPADTTLVDLIGDYTGPDSGAAADDNIKAHLDLIKTAADAILVDTAAADTEAEIADLGSTLVDNIVAAMDANSTLDDILTDTSAMDSEAEWADLGSALVDNIVAAMDANSTLATVLADTEAMDSEAEWADLSSTVVDNIQAAMDANSTLLYWQERSATITMAGIATPTNNLFDVDGGPILITSFVGICTETIDANVMTLQITNDADGGITDTEFSTAVSCEDDVAGTIYVFTNVNPSVLTPLVTGTGEGATTLMTPWVCKEGMIECAASAANLTGTIVWYMRWRPLVTGVTVTAQ